MPLVNVLTNSTIAGIGGGKVIRGNAPPPIFLDYLVVGGGGETGGGGGGVVSGSIRFLPRFTLDVIVGNGGTGSTTTEAEPSIIDTISPASEFFVYAGGGGQGTSGNPQFNLAGGSDDIYAQGGAGGSSSNGFAGAGSVGGKGGSGSLWLDGITYAGGGGGFGTFFIPNTGTGGAGQAGGGNGQDYQNQPGNGVANTGGGGGGSYDTTSNGGSGIVKMRYLSGSVSGAIGGTITSQDGYTYHTFTGSGQFVYQP